MTREEFVALFPTEEDADRFVETCTSSLWRPLALSPLQPPDAVWLHDDWKLPPGKQHRGSWDEAAAEYALAQAGPSKAQMDTLLPVDAHYTDRRFDQGARIIFGWHLPGLYFDYDDRLRQWDIEKHRTAWTAAVDSGATPTSARFYSVYLSVYYGRPTQLICLYVGVNRSNGYPYLVLGSKEVK